MDPLEALNGQLHSPDRDIGPDTDLHTEIGISIDPDDLGGAVVELTARMTVAVPSFLGFTVTITGETNGPTLTAVGAPAHRQIDRPALTSLGFSIPLRGGGLARFTVYAHQLGALVDLDADLTYLRRRAGGRSHAARTATDVRLDQDLPAPALLPTVTGLEEQSTLDRAEGALIDQGIHPDDATSKLRQRAAAAGLDPHSYARQLLDALIAGR